MLEQHGPNPLSHSDALRDRGFNADDDDLVRKHIQIKASAAVETDP